MSLVSTWSMPDLEEHDTAFTVAPENLSVDLLPSVSPSSPSSNNNVEQKGVNAAAQTVISLGSAGWKRLQPRRSPGRPRIVSVRSAVDSSYGVPPYVPPRTLRKSLQKFSSGSSEVIWRRSNHFLR